MYIVNNITFSNEQDFFSHIYQNGPCEAIISGNKVFAVCSYEDVNFVLRRFDFTKVSEGSALGAANMLSADYPDHIRHRQLIQEIFYNIFNSIPEERIYSICYDTLIGIRNKKSFDVVEEYCEIIPIKIIGEIMGIEPKTIREFHLISRKIMSLGDSTVRNENDSRYLSSLYHLLDNRMAFLLKKGRVETGLISQVRDIEELSEREKVSNLVLLLVAGHETVINLTASAIYLFLSDVHSHNREPQFGSKPIDKVAVNELLRFISPLQRATYRAAKNDMQYKGIKIRRGQRVGLTQFCVDQVKQL